MSVGWMVKINDAMHIYIYICIKFISIHLRSQEFINSSDITVFRAVGMEQQSRGRRLNVAMYIYKIYKYINTYIYIGDTRKNQPFQLLYSLLRAGTILDQRKSFFVFL